MPFKSKAQQKFLFAAAKRGEVKKSVPKEFAAATKNFKALPEKVGAKNSAPKISKSEVATPKISKGDGLATALKSAAKFSSGKK